jgi:hypothetical protein
LRISEKLELGKIAAPEHAEAAIERDRFKGVNEGKMKLYYGMDGTRGGQSVDSGLFKNH